MEHSIAIFLISHSGEPEELYNAWLKRSGYVLKNPEQARKIFALFFDLCDMTISEKRSLYEFMKSVPDL